jgi:hypothetical protein
MSLADLSLGTSALLYLKRIFAGPQLATVPVLPITSVI